MKRFTETTKWDDPWFRSLSPTTKLLWQWLLDHCDIAGVIRPDLGLASFQIGQPVNEQNLTELGDRVKALEGGKFLIAKFVSFQFGELSTASQVHRSVVKTFQSHGLQPPNPKPVLCQPLSKPSPTLDQGLDRGSPTPKEKEKEKEKEEGGYGGKHHPDSRKVITILNESTGRTFREVESNLSIISSRLREPGVTLDGVRTMIARQHKRWKGTRFEEYLRPETLFNKSKFDGYYAAKDQEINENNEPAHPQRVDRSIGTANEGIADQYKNLGGSNGH